MYIRCMKTLRTRFKKEIVAEFLPPQRKVKKQRVIVFCDGMPGTPGKKALLKFYSKKGFWVFHPRYRGSWESSGKFLNKSPEEDILDVISGLPKGFVDLWYGQRYTVEPDELYIFASSFGGPAAILASRDPRVTKVVSFCPVVDWTAPSKAEPLDFVEKYAREAFGEGYRFSHADWKKLSTGKFYNPSAYINEIDGKKIFVIHAKDDESVLWDSVAKFAKKVKCKFLLLKTGGHISSSNFINPRFYKRINQFLQK